MPQVNGLEVDEVIGRGGFGTVYRARQSDLGRVVALKVIHPGGQTDQDVLVRFERECRAIGSLTGHPAVVTVFEAGATDEGDPYMVLEYLPGGSLQERLARDGAIPWTGVIVVALAIADALAAAHAIGIVHRDVKPANVLCDRFGNYKLGDFGIAGLGASGNTTLGATAATVAFADPEILLGRRATEASDLYSLGALMYALLNSVPAFTMATDESVVPMMLRVTGNELEPLGEDLAPESLRTLIAELMAKDPADRPEGAAAVVARLRAIEAAEVGADSPAFDALGGGAPLITGVPTFNDEFQTVLRREPPQPREPAQPQVSASLPDLAPPAPPDAPGPSLTGPEVAVASGAAVGHTGVGAGDVEPVDASPQVVDPTGDGASGLDDDTKSRPTGLPLAGASGREGSDTIEDLDPIREAEDGDAPKRSRKVLALAGILVALLAAAGAAFGASQGSSPSVTVPDLSGMTAKAATAALVEAGVSAERIRTERVSADLSLAGKVISQRPSAGATYADGSSVVLSVGADGVVVPSVVGKTEAQANAILLRAGLVPHTKAEYSSTVPRPLVIRTGPKAGVAVVDGAKVTIVVSKGSAPRVIPTLVGLTLGDAVAKLDKLGLRHAEVQQASDKAAGTVLAQSAPPGAKAPPKATVTLTVSSGPAPVVVATTQPVTSTTRPSSSSNPSQPTSTVDPSPPPTATTAPVPQQTCTTTYTPVVRDPVTGAVSGGDPVTVCR